MEEEGVSQQNTWEGYVDWRSRPAVRGRHGGMLPAFFVLVAEVLENLAFLANASNLVLYLSEHMHYSPSESANSVTNFMGTAFLLALLGGFLSDAFFTTYHIYLISALIELLGLVILTTQAHIPSLKPPPCDPSDPTTAACRQARGGQAAMLFLGLYMAALGVGGIKGSLPAHGAEQFDEGTAKGRKRRSTFFNYFVFCLSLGGLVAVTLVVWVEDNVGWEWGLGVASLAVFLSIPIFLVGSTTYRNKVPSGSPLTTIFKVLASATLNTCLAWTSSNAITSLTTTNKAEQKQAPQDTTLQCSAEQVEQVEIVVKMLPIFASTIMLNACLAQLSTFSVHQAAAMDTNVGLLKLPPASLPVFPVLFIMSLAPLYNHLLLPLARRATASEAGVTHLQRIGTGLALAVLAMAVAAVVEAKRKKSPVPMSFLWIGIQYLFLGSADLFTLAGLLEFFFTEAPTGMRSLATSLSWASLAFGYYLSSVIVSAVNAATGSSGGRAWLSGRDLNEYQLERFYWLMCVLSGLNYLVFLFWAVKYKYRTRIDA